MVPEWHETYMNYNFLKSIIKDIQTFKIKNIPNLHHHRDHDNHPIPLTRKMSLYRTFSGLTSFPRHQHTHHHHRDHHNNHHHTTQVSPDPENPPPPPPPIAVKTVTATAVEHKYETQFLMAGEQGGEYELVFFKRLDDEFNKVDKFYRSKVEEVMNEAEELNMQMNALIAFRIKVDKPHQDFVQMNNLDMIEEGSSSTNHGTPSDDSSCDEEAGTMGSNNLDQLKMNSIPASNQSIVRHPRQASLEILENVSLGKNGSTIKRFLSIPKYSDLKFSKKNLHKAEKKLQLAFVEFYHKLRLLKSYRYVFISF